MDNNAEIIANYTQWVESIRSIARIYLIPKDDAEISGMLQKDSKRMGDAVSAVEVAVSLVGIFHALMTQHSVSSQKALTDISFTLAENPFWVQYQSFLMPLYQASFNAIQDFHLSKKEPLWDKMEYRNKYLWLEILPLIAKQLYGFAYMRKVSYQFKKSIEGLVK